MFSQLICLNTEVLKYKITAESQIPEAIEVEMSTKKMKKFKSRGIDNIPEKLKWDERH